MSSAYRSALSWVMGLATFDRKDVNETRVQYLALGVELARAERLLKCDLAWDAIEWGGAQ